MSFFLKAPYPNLSTTTVLPSPKWGDSKALTATITSMRAIDGTLYTYVKTRDGRKRFQWSFEISRNKAFELRAFIDSYHGKIIQINNHNNDTYLGYLRNNPFEFTGSGRAGNSWPGNETMTILLEFEEK